jgi:hypothetical protein
VIKNASNNCAQRPEVETREEAGIKVVEILAFERLRETNFPGSARQSSGGQTLPFGRLFEIVQRALVFHQPFHQFELVYL